MTSQRINDDALSELAAIIALHIERAPGPMEKRLLLRRAFVQAHALNHSVTDDPALTLLDSLIREPDQRMQKLQSLWKGNH